ncbi:MAG: sigma-54-dependent Fis family transcriptional regulator [Candidatus Tectomicrobia bacterium]|nr:sigma-54-dependent Fis family transcriptional regulator [Candidatus Tectomicrobia bacterium]
MFAHSKLLIVDDDQDMGQLLADFLAKQNFDVVFTTNPMEAIEEVREEDFDLVITDLRMDGATGMDVLRQVKRIKPSTSVIIITAFGSVESAVEAIQEGAFFYISKPFKMREILITVNMALEKRRLEQENTLLRQEVHRKYHFDQIIGKSKPMLEIFELIKTLSNNTSNVMIYGDSGTGKELVAKAIHYNSTRRDRPFVPINCTAIPEGLLESELFGHVRGSFTGAVTTKKGLFERASDGTLFLDEIGDMGVGLQGKLLRVLQDKMIRPVGSTTAIHVNTRIIAATNKNLEEEIKAKRFREDLFYRLNVIPIQLPPLREHPEDIPLLVEHFLTKFSKEMGSHVQGIARDALNKLVRYSWPGNVRELENVIERAFVLTKNIILQVDDIYLPGKSDAEESMEEVMQRHPSLEELERVYIKRILRETNGRKEMAANILGIDRRTLYRKERKYQLRVE